MQQLPSTPFFATRAERVELARRRYFDDGLAPSGIVGDAVFQSWARCQRLHADPSGEVVFEPVTVSRTQLALQKNRHLHEAWREELPQLQVVLGATSCAAMLTDATGVLIGATCAGRSHERLMPVATRIGVNLSEEAVGTTAPGVVARTGQAVSVLGAEHFFENVKAMQCAASPIRDVHGRIAGVLDISSEAIPFNFDAAAVVSVYAGALENRLLVAQSHEHLVIRFQVAASLLDSPVVALLGIDALGRLAWRNGVAARLLGLPELADPGQTPSAETVLGARLPQLASLPLTGAAPLRLPNGLAVWARSEMRAADGWRHLVPAAIGEAPAATASPADDGASPSGATTQAVTADVQEAIAPDSTSLRDADLDLIERTLDECGGNVSKAARRLRVSRGLIYRRLRTRQATHD